jgi:hypothetical protein
MEENTIIEAFVRFRFASICHYYVGAWCPATAREPRLVTALHFYSKALATIAFILCLS